jgi:hypothetical protein
MARVIRAEAAARGVSEEEVRQAHVRTTSLCSFIPPEQIAAMSLLRSRRQHQRSGDRR